jgi:tetratricopeptide (TPR) repeat protein
MAGRTAGCLCILLLAGLCGFGVAGQAQTTTAEIQSLIHAHRYDEALAAIQDGLRRAPDNYRLWTLEGILFSMKGRRSDASQAFQRALKIAPQYPAALRGQAQILFQSDDQRAIPLLERILKLNARDETAHEMLAVLEVKKGDCRAALRNFAATGDAMRAHPASLEGWGKCLLQNHEPQKAAEAFRQLSALLPGRAWAQYDLAVALMEAKQSEAAVKVLEPLLSDQNDPDILSLASDAYEATGDTPKAVSLMRQAIVLNPANPAYYVGFAALCLNHDAFQVGIDMVTVGLRHISGEPSLYISRGLLYAHLAQYDRAEADFQQAERLDSKQSLTAYAIDLTDLQKNKSDATIGRIRAQLRAHPDSALLNYLLAKLLWSQGNQTETAGTAEALQHVQLAVKLKPDMVEARNLLADLYIAGGQYGPALEQSRIALRADPLSQTAVYHLIVALRHSPPGPQRDEIPTLVKRLSELQRASLQQETERKRFTFVEQRPASAQ